MEVLEMTIDKDKVIVCKSTSHISVSYNGKRMIVRDLNLLEKDKNYIKEWYIGLYGKGDNNG